jgi:hypothetical protein
MGNRDYNKLDFFTDIAVKECSSYLVRARPVWSGLVGWVVITITNHSYILGGFGAEVRYESCVLGVSQCIVINT